MVAGHTLPIPTHDPLSHLIHGLGEPGPNAGVLIGLGIQSLGAGMGSLLLVVVHVLLLLLGW